MRKLLLLAITIAACTAAAQETKVTGRLLDRDTKDPMPLATVQLLQPDSTYIAGSTTSEDGIFEVTSPSSGKYILKLSSVGYTTQYKNIAVTDSTGVDMGDIILGADAVMLKGTTVTEQARKVILVEDTFIYNAAAYRTPEGSVVEELIKRLPGAQIDDEGTITINGKEVKKIKVDGKEFLTGDTKTATKYLPTSIVDKVKAYDEKSDMSRITGIDDGNETTVLDFALKEGMHKGTFGEASGAYGTEDRYTSRFMGAIMNSKTRLMGLGGANNVNDKGFGGGGGRGSFGAGRQGLNSSKNVAMNFNYDDGNKLQTDGSLRYNHTNSDSRTKSSSENFVSTTGSFSNSLSQSYSRSNSWNAQARLEWKPDTMTNIMFRPTMSISYSDSRSTSSSASYSEDPYDYTDDPLSDEAIETMNENGLMVNKNSSTSISYSDSKSFGASAQYNRRFGSRGRNINLSVEGSYSESDGKSLSTNNVHLYQVTNSLGADSTYQTNRYRLTPTRNWSYSAQVAYSEPLWKGAFLQLSYKFSYSFRKSDQSTYDFSNLGEDFFGNVIPTYRGWNSYLSLLDNSLDSYFDEDLSRYSEYKNYTHDIELTYRMISNSYNLSVGVLLQPQSSKFIQDYFGTHSDTARTVFNVSPTMHFRYRFSKRHSLEMRYRGTTSQPDISNLIDITDDSDPLNISMGNPGLKPSFTNNMNIRYNNYIESHYQAIAANFSYSTTRNSISNKVTYDETTGGRITRPENINGNWNMSGGVTYSFAIDTLANWNVLTRSAFNYQNYVAYLALDETSDAVKNTTKNMTLSETLEASYRNDWLEVALVGSVDYSRARNKLQSESDLDTWQYSYGTTIDITMPWGTRIATDIKENSRRGYSDNSMNTNELVWNAQISQSFLKGKPLTVMLQFYDILDNQSNFSRTVNSMGRNDTEYNSINSYAMLSVVFRFNAFGNKEARREMRRAGRNFNGEGPGGEGPGGGGPGGGPGGGGPGGGGGFGGPPGM